eukprot:424133_1
MSSEPSPKAMPHGVLNKNQSAPTSSPTMQPTEDPTPVPTPSPTNTSITSSPTNHPTPSPTIAASISDARMDQLLNQRTTMPPQCNNSKNNIINVEPMDHNWAPYYLRCKYMPLDGSAQSNRWFEEGIVTKELIYSHIFKAGGTTIQRGILKLIENNKIIDLTPFLTDHVKIVHGGITYNNYDKVTQFMDDDTVSFSFVRDPLSKFLSAFFETSSRIEAMPGGGHIIPAMRNIGLSLSKYLEQPPLDTLHTVLGKIKQEHDLFYTRHRNSRRLFPANYLNAHYRPNMFFLMPTSNRDKSLKFRFIGNTAEMNNDLPQLIEPFIIDPELQNNSKLLMEQYFGHERNRQSTDYVTRKVQRFNIDKLELSDQDIQNICEIYWLDYLCFPFEIPEQCNIRDLMNKHYGKDVEYEECY